MRTDREISDKLMADVMKAGAFKTKREAVEEALKTYMRSKDRPKMLDLFGKLDWDGYPVGDITRDKAAVADRNTRGARQSTRADAQAPRRLLHERAR